MLAPDGKPPNYGARVTDLRDCKHILLNENDEQKCIKTITNNFKYESVFRARFLSPPPSEKGFIDFHFILVSEEFQENVKKL